MQHFTERYTVLPGTGRLGHQPCMFPARANITSHRAVRRVQDVRDISLAPFQPWGCPGLFFVVVVVVVVVVVCVYIYLFPSPVFKFNKIF